MLISILMILLIISSVNAQTTDIDKDGIKDSQDKCEDTLTNELPIITNNFEFVGCSCKQIREKLFEPYCVDVVCGAGTNLVLNYKNTPYELQCSPTYCINNTLYAFDTTTETTQCLNGNLIKEECTPIITENSSSCKKGIYPQLSELNTKPEKNKDFNDSGIGESKKDYTDQIYVVYRSTPELFSEDAYEREQFKQKIEQTSVLMTAIGKSMNVDEKIGENIAKIKKREIVLGPIRGYSAKKILFFEKIIADIDLDNIIYEKKPFFVDYENRILVWKYDHMKSQQRISLNYKIPLVNDFDTQFVVIADVEKEIDFITPVILVIILLMLLGVYFWLKVRIKKDKEK